jgi:antitoxin YefM
MDIFNSNEPDFYQIPRFKLSFRRFCLPDFPSLPLFCGQSSLANQNKSGLTCTIKCASQGVAFMRVINFSEARSSLKGVIDQVISDADYTVISRRDAPDAVLMSLDTFNGLMETVHLLKSPANAAHLARSVEQYRSGQVQHRDLVDAE